MDKPKCPMVEQYDEEALALLKQRCVHAESLLLELFYDEVLYDSIIERLEAQPALRLHNENWCQSRRQHITKLWGSSW